MKNLHKFIICCSILLIGCDDKAESLENLNASPFVEYYTISKGIWINSINYQTIKDSVKFYNTANKLPYSVALKFKDPNNNFGYVNLESTQSENIFYVDEQEYHQNFKVNLKSFSISHKNSFDLTKKFKLVVYDNWDKSHELYFDLTYFDNMLPVSILKTNIINNNEYEFDASSSYDKDKKWGGYIKEYEYVINNITVITTLENKIKHVFTSGTHNIKLRVKDSDNIWSDYVEKNITIN